jgi:hypothetical protein
MRNVIGTSGKRGFAPIVDVVDKINVRAPVAPPPPRALTESLKFK